MIKTLYYGAPLLMVFFFIFSEQQMCAMEKIKKDQKDTSFERKTLVSTESLHKILANPTTFAQWDLEKLVVTMIELKADINAKTKSGYTLLHTAIFNDCPLNIIELLCHAGVDLYTRTVPSASYPDGYTALDAAIHKGRKDVFDLILMGVP